VFDPNFNPKADFCWTQDEWDGSDFASASPSAWLRVRSFGSRHGWLVRGVILVLGLVVFELTSNAAISTAVSCLEFGRTDFQTAWWLLKTDPDRRRGSLCARCSLAWACWRVSLVALIVIVLIVIWGIVSNQAGQGPIDPLAHLAGAFGLLSATITLGSLLSLMVVITSMKARKKLWLGPEPRWAKQQKVWPPTAAYRHRSSFNQAKTLFYLGCFCIMFPILVITTFVCFLNPVTAIPWVFLVIIGLILLGTVVLISHLERRVLARSPLECWPLEDGEPFALI